MEEHKLPLGVLKQITIKFDSILNDISEVLESDIDFEDRERFIQMKEVIKDMITSTYATVIKEIDEDEFNNQYCEMDEMENPFNEMIELQ